ncbi:MAG: hypothetical protein K2X55_15340 [Burkholderiaceae bacterium]|nr:hypothetical protein [Burkholderiaceae bacterium]
MHAQRSQENHASNSPLGREFAAYIKDQYASQLAQSRKKAGSAGDIDDQEEAILVRSFYYRIMRTAFIRNGLAHSPGSDFVSAATAHQWATLDAMDFRNVNNIDRNRCTHCAEIICASPSPFYRSALQRVAPDVLEIAHAAIRTEHAQRRPQPAPPSDAQGVLALSLPRSAPISALRLAPSSHSHQR